MKVLRYKSCMRINRGTQGEPQWEEILVPVTMGWNEANEETVKATAYNGEYVIEDDGQPDPAEIPTRLDTIEAQIAYTAMMTDTLLEV